MPPDADSPLPNGNDAPAPSPPEPASIVQSQAEPLPGIEPLSGIEPHPGIEPLSGIEPVPGPTLRSPEPAPEPGSLAVFDASVVPPPVVPPQPAPRPRASLIFLTVVTVVSLAADLVTKWWAKSRLEGRPHGVRKVEVLKEHIDFIFAQNPGGAWSFLRGLPDTLRRPFFLVVSSAAIVFIVSIYQRVYKDQTAMKWGLPLALGGAMGNLVDRIRYGWVVDFVDVYVTRGKNQHHWPTFNVADIAIVVGVALMAIDMMRSRGVRVADDAPAPSSAPAA